MIDVGCGSGILGITMAKLWKKPIELIDIDKRSIKTSKANAKLNFVNSFIKVKKGNGLNITIEVQYDEETGDPTGAWIITFTGDGGTWISNDLTGPQGPAGEGEVGPQCPSYCTKLKVLKETDASVTGVEEVRCFPILYKNRGEAWIVPDVALLGKRQHH